MYTEESLDNLRHSIDIVDVLSEHLHLKRSGATYKACCPFHIEKTPSFLVNPTGAYYHCFGCGVHGDAIAFLMQYLGYSFTEAVLVLSKKFHVDLVIKPTEFKNNLPIGIKEQLRNINSETEKFFRYCLYCLPEGQKALQYLYHRGFSPDTIDRFRLGYGPEESVFLQGMQDRQLSRKQLQDAGFFGKKWFLFSRRIIFPIHDALGHTVGFSSRKFLENAQGSKYVNTPETPIFKKSRILFGLNFSRRRIAKEKKAILVEGQADCLQMIDFGFNCTLAAQGTAFTEEHVKELTKLGVLKVFLLFDSDEAGNKAVLRVGDLCQVAGIAVFVCQLPEGYDPDSFLMQKGSTALIALLEKSKDYLTFLVSKKVQACPTFTPREKAVIVEEVIRQIKQWGNPIFVYEHLKQLASLMTIPEDMVLALAKPQIQRERPVTSKQKIPIIHPDVIIETDVIRCLLFCKASEHKILYTAKHYFVPEDFKYQECRQLFTFLIHYYETHHKRAVLDEALAMLTDKTIIELLTKRRFNLDILDFVAVQSFQKLADRQWRQQCHSRTQFPQQSNERKLAILEDYVQIQKDKITITLIDPKEEVHFSS
ncbi:DNA primase [Candidatus Chlamydia sanziniae]|uniref:DNA primase n=1 Tax=Candidatus Chlamydia sanziniae TaxID=1806891 RepID=A0A1A9HV69_9CHLA|nr:DNA primase [Candidatus Chlamydia sanziniae]ANH78735.1 DNA primase [Candidatus Chlamydia sanziniae]